MTTIPDHVFRGYDLRGLVDKELTVENVEILGKAYATYLLSRRIYDCVVGFDCRTSGPKFRDAFIKGLNDSGVTAYDIGVTLSQMCYFAQYYFRTRGMAMITASHNPKEYNGFKFGIGYSETMLTQDILDFRDLAKSGKFLTHSPKGQHIQKDIKQIYIDDIIRHTGKVAKFKVVVDSCAATTGLFLPDLLRQAGCEVIEQNTTPDGNFPVGTPDPTETEVLKRLAKGVIAAKADVGFAYDADGDRLGIVDGQGGIIHNDTLLCIYAKDVLDFLPGSKIIFNTLCSKQVDDVVRERGGIPVIWKTGHSFIKAKVRDERAPFGGELSGHFYFVDNFYGHDDGAIASLRILAYLSRVNKSLSQVIAELPQYVSSPEIKLGCPDNIKFSLISDKIGNDIKTLYPKAKYVEIDGVRMDTESTMLIIRASQNGPYLTVKFEGKTQVEYDNLKKQVAEILHKYPEVDFASGVNKEALN
jgi:phosphomannomutase / phosphoglucomutase